MVRTRLLLITVALISTACHTMPEAPSGKIDPAVIDALRSTGEAHVLVSLHPPEGYGSEGADLEEMKAAISVLQEAVLAELASEAYRNRVRFDVVPGLAGTVLDESALEVLARHPTVQRVTLDAGGVGHGR